MAGEEARDAGLTVKEELSRIMKATIDRLQTEMDHRFKRLHDEDIKFEFLLNSKELCYGNEHNNLHGKCIQLGKVYQSDFDDRKLLVLSLYSMAMKVYSQT
jgi:hypothetical protein